MNFPNVSSPKTDDARICVLHANVPTIIQQITSVLAELGVNIENYLNKSKGDNAYSMIDVSATIGKNAEDKLAAIEGVYSVRVID